MPVPCQVPCGLCGDTSCKCRTEKKVELTQGEAEKFLREHEREDFDFKSAVLKALSTDDKDLPSWSDPENPIC